jgi:hypothetical protein
MPDLGPLFAAAEQAAAAGIRDAVDHANRVEPNWSEQALAALRAFALQHPEPFTIEAARAAMDTLPLPPDLRAWGAVTQRAIRLGIVRRTGTFARRAASHNSPTMLYVRGTLREE